MNPKRSPWTFVPSLYFQQGLPVILVQQFSVLMYKKLGVGNEQILFWTSLLAWPWVVKMFWGPVVDLNGTKRGWTLWMQLVIAVLLFALSFVLPLSGFWPLSLAILGAMAFFSATHDIASDGYYLVALKKEDQAFFMGITSMFFRLAMVFCSGGLVVLAGLWERDGVAIPTAWSRAVLVGAILYSLLAIYGKFIFPKTALDRPAPKKDAAAKSFLEAFTTFFTQKDALSIVLFVLFYRFGESMLTKLSGLFILDPHAAGGLGFDSIQAGKLIGTFGVVSLMSGGLLGGIAVSRWGLRRCIWPMTLFMHIPNLMYVWASHALPGSDVMAFVISIDQFAYGFGMASYMVYTMYVCQKSSFQASHYAIVTALMAFGAMLAGMSAGYIQGHFGYFWAFVGVCTVTIPGMLLLFWIPMDDEKVSATFLPDEALAGAVE